MKANAKKKSVSVELLMENFHDDFQNGKSISEISKAYGVDLSYIYKMLEKIAEKNGVTRDFYMVRSQKKHAEYEHVSPCSYTKYDEDKIKELDESFDRILSEVRKIKGQMNWILNENSRFITTKEDTTYEA